MITPVNSATHAQATVQTKATLQPQAQAKTQPGPTDTITISAAKQIVQEAIESSSQTAREAANGDNQAKRLLAREAAQHQSVK